MLDIPLYLTRYNLMECVITQVGSKGSEKGNQPEATWLKRKSPDVPPPKIWLSPPPNHPDLLCAQGCNPRFQEKSC